MGAGLGAGTQGERRLHQARRRQPRVSMFGSSVRQTEVGIRDDDKWRERILMEPSANSLLGRSCLGSLATSCAAVPSDRHLAKQSPFHNALTFGTWNGDFEWYGL